MHIKSKLVAALALAVFVLPGITLAQSTATASSNAALAAQIQTLTAQVKALQAQLATSKTSATVSVASSPVSDSGLPPPSAPTSSTTITIKAPASGQIFTQGTYNNVTWSGGTSPVVLDLYNSTAQAMLGTITASSSIINTGSYLWDARTIYLRTLTGETSTAITTGSYTIKIVDEQGDSATSSAFTVATGGLPAPGPVPPSPLPTPAPAAPSISQVSPSIAPPGMTVTVVGQNFDANSYISLGNVPTGPENFPVAATSRTATSLTFSVPANFAFGVQPLYVAEHNSGLVSNKGIITIIAIPNIIGVTSAGATPTPGSNENLIGTNLPTANAIIVLDAGSASTQTITPTGYNVGGGGNITFVLPSTVSIGSHTIEVQASGVTSNKFTFMVVPALSVPLCTNVSAACQASQAVCTSVGTCSSGSCTTGASCATPQQYGGCGGVWTPGCAGAWNPPKATVTTQTSDTGSQTAIITQSLQGILNELAGILRSL